MLLESGIKAARKVECSIAAWCSRAKNRTREANKVTSFFFRSNTTGSTLWRSRQSEDVLWCDIFTMEMNAQRFPLFPNALLSSSIIYSWTESSCGHASMIVDYNTTRHTTTPTSRTVMLWGSRLRIKNLLPYLYPSYFHFLFQSIPLHFSFFLLFFYRIFIQFITSMYIRSYIASA